MCSAREGGGRYADDGAVIRHTGTVTATKPTVIVGLGKTGISCARFVNAAGISIAVVDSRAAPPELATLRAELPKVPVYLGRFVESVLSSAAALVVSPGVSLREPAIRRAMARGIPVLGDIELFARAAWAPIIAITGSNGKSTVTTLVGEMARHDGRQVRVGGNLGPPALDLLCTPQGWGESPPGRVHSMLRGCFPGTGHISETGRAPRAPRGEAKEGVPDLFVLELSSFQLETTFSLRPASSVVLNLSADHLDRYDDIPSYVAAKRRIYDGDGVMVLNLDDPQVASMARPGRRMVGFTLGKPRSERDYGLLDGGNGPWLARGGSPILPVNALQIRGLHSLANALAALALGDAVGLSTAAMREALSRFAGLSHRCELVATDGGVHWYNDSKATNVGATVAAIRSLGVPGKLILIAGGDGKGADFTPLRAAAAGVVRAMVLLGCDAPRIESAVRDVVPVVRAMGMAEAVAIARELACPGDCVLLSPACASLDMYSGYQARGEAFVAALKGASLDEVPVRARKCP